MPTTFLDLPSELRNVIYALTLVLSSPVQIYYQLELNVVLERSPAFTPNILFANKQIHSETRSVLYSANVFSFESATYEDTARFFDRIGRQNAALIRSVVIPFPKLQEPFERGLTFDREDLLLLFSIRCDCVGLRMLQTSPGSFEEMERMLDQLDDLKKVEKILSLVDARFKVFEKLDKVVVVMYKEDGRSYISQIMEKLGWILEEEEEEKPEDTWEDERDFDRGWDSEQDPYERYSESDEEYDIDNDSDFWRRAAD